MSFLEEYPADWSGLHLRELHAALTTSFHGNVPEGVKIDDRVLIFQHPNGEPCEADEAIDYTQDEAVFEEGADAAP